MKIFCCSFSSGPSGRSAQLPKLILIGTHADRVGDCVKTDDGDFLCERFEIFLSEIKEIYRDDFDFYEKIFLIDAVAAGTQSIRNLLAVLNLWKDRIVQKLKTTTVFLDRCATQIQQNWRKNFTYLPVLSWSRFLEAIRQEVNPLATDEHIRDLVQQLQSMGEVKFFSKPNEKSLDFLFSLRYVKIIYIEGDPQEDFICFDPNWLCQTVFGRLLTFEKVSKRFSSSNETFTRDDLRNLFPEVNQALDLIRILNAYELCTSIDVNGDFQFEFPQLNTIDLVPSLWEKRSGVQYVYIGCEIRSRTLPELLWSIFPRIQVQLRRLTMTQDFLRHGAADEVELFQWTDGSKLIVGMMELLLTKILPTHLELKARGQIQNREQIFYLFNDVLLLLDDVVNQMCPMLQIEHHYISSKHLHLNQNNYLINGSMTKPSRKRLTSLCSLPTPENETTPNSFISNESKTILSPYYRTYSPKLIAQTLLKLNFNSTVSLTEEVFSFCFYCR